MAIPTDNYRTELSRVMVRPAHGMPLPGARLTPEDAQRIIAWGAEAMVATAPERPGRGGRVGGWSRLAEATGINAGSLYQIATGKRPASRAVVITIQKWWKAQPGVYSGMGFCGLLQVAKSPEIENPY